MSTRYRDCMQAGSGVACSKKFWTHIAKSRTRRPKDTAIIGMRIYAYLEIGVSQYMHM